MKKYPHKTKSTLRRCKVEVLTANGKSHAYYGFFKTTMDAVIDALDRFGLGGKVSVRRAI